MQVVELVEAANGEDGPALVQSIQSVLKGNEALSANIPLAHALNKGNSDIAHVLLSNEGYTKVTEEYALDGMLDNKGVRVLRKILADNVDTVFPCHLHYLDFRCQPW